MLKTNSPAKHGVVVPFTVLMMFVMSSIACDIDQHFGRLTVNSTPQTFTPAVAENHSWPAVVIPNTKYEVIIKLATGNLNGKENCMRVNDENGSTIYGSECGSITAQQDLTVVFTGPSDGKILILFVPATGQATCTIELKAIP